MIRVAIRVGKLLAVVVIVSFLTFVLTKLLPGDPANTILGSQASNKAAVAAVHKELGLDQPFLSQYVHYLDRVVLHFDFGRAYSNGFQVKTLLADRLPATIELILLAQVLALVVAVPLALFSAYRPSPARTRRSRRAPSGSSRCPASPWPCCSCTCSPCRSTGSPRWATTG